jgi:hypothetical protein
MKKIIILFILINSLSCKKEWFDYTNKYTGNFQFTTNYSFHDPSTGVSSYSTDVYNGTIKKIKRGKIKIKIDAGKNDFFDVEINKEGEFSQGYLGGRFLDKNNVTIGYRTGGLGGGGYYSIKGVRN